jgi:hypothetical protein
MNKLKEMDGNEVWTWAFGDRVCCLVKYPYVWIEGEKRKPTKKQINQMWKDLMVQEFGTSDITTILRNEGFGVE